VDDRRLPDARVANQNNPERRKSRRLRRSFGFSILRVTDRRASIMRGNRHCCMLCLRDWLTVRELADHAMTTPGCAVTDCQPAHFRGATILGAMNRPNHNDGGNDAQTLLLSLRNGFPC
jgi:hypothetical protein